MVRVTPFEIQKSAHILPQDIPFCPDAEACKLQVMLCVNAIQLAFLTKLSRL